MESKSEGYKVNRRWVRGDPSFTVHLWGREELGQEQRRPCSEGWFLMFRSMGKDVLESQAWRWLGEHGGGRVPGKRRWVSSSELSTKIINKQSIKEIEKSFIWAKVRTVAWKPASQIILRNCLREAWFSAHFSVMSEWRPSIKRTIVMRAYSYEYHSSTEKLFQFWRVF